MTTTVKVEANHGWPVRVRTIDPASKRQLHGDLIIPAGETRNCYVHSGCDLEIHEIQPEEIDAPAAPLQHTEPDL